MKIKAMTKLKNDQKMTKTKIIQVQNTPITIISEKGNDFICLTDMAKAKAGDARAADIIKNWIRTRTSLEFIGTWEEMYNPGFKVVEFDHFKMQAGLPSFVLSPGQWIEKTNAIGMYVSAGRYGGTFAHKDIAFEFGSAISPVFKLFLIKEFQRLKTDESHRLKLDWSLQRTLAKVNYHLHTSAIREKLIPKELTKTEAAFVYATEADLLNMALFGKTAVQWRNENPLAEGNIRDDAALEQLVVLTNLESLNAVWIEQGISSSDRLLQLNKIAIQQLKTLSKSPSLKKFH